MLGSYGLRVPAPSVERWNTEYASGRWAYVGQLPELSRLSVVVGYLRHFAPGGSVLDLGCGEGFLLRRLQPSDYARYVGVDFSGAAIDKATALRLPEATFVTADVDAYRPTETFDAIVFTEVLYYLPDPVRTVAVRAPPEREGRRCRVDEHQLPRWSRDRPEVEAAARDAGRGPVDPPGWAPIVGLRRFRRESMIAAVKRRVREILRRFGYEVVHSEHVESHAFVRHLTHLFDKLAIQCVLDVGANRGQYRQLLRDRVGYQGLIISFEPLAQNIASLRAQAEADPRWVIRGHALGSADTEMDINVMKADLLSSFLAPDPAMVPMFRPVNVIDRRERVAVRRLDSVIEELGSERPLRNVYLKLDTQGFDLEVIRGAAATMPRVRALQTEISMQPLYQQAPSYRRRWMN